jgi:Phytanoyl-CoA dioxygenase (PhyH)
MIHVLQKLRRRGMILYVLQRLCTWYPLRVGFARVLAATKPRRLLADAITAKPIVSRLNRDGFTWLPGFVSDAQVNGILAHLEGGILSERYGQKRNGFIIDDVPENVHVAEYGIEHLLRCRELIALMQNQLLMDVATMYLGCAPTVSNVSVWWSFPADGTAQEAENYHRDVDDWRFVKFFLYLTDVDEETGPHRFVKGSHCSTRFLVVRRLTDKEVVNVFGAKNCLKLVGQKGDAFLEDTFGLHKGEPPRNRRRLALQIEYSINPIAVYDYTPLDILNANVDDEYATRLYVRHQQSELA